MDESAQAGILTPDDHALLDGLLVSAAQSGSADVAGLIYDYGAPYSSDAVYTALQTAIFYDRESVLEYLIDEEGCDLSDWGEGQASLLELSILHGGYDSFQFLVQRSAWTSLIRRGTPPPTWRPVPSNFKS